MGWRTQSHGMPPDEPDPMSYIDEEEEDEGVLIECSVPFCGTKVDSYEELLQHEWEVHPERFNEED